MRTFSRPGQVLFLSIGLAAAGPCPTTNVVIPGPSGPPTVATQVSRYYTDKREFPCFTSAPGPEVAQPREGYGTYVGFTNRYRSWNYVALTCWWWGSRQYRGFVKFDLSPLRQREVVLAFLRYVVRSTDTNAPQVFPNSCAESLWVATTSQMDLDTPGELVHDGIPGDRNRQLSIDVTDAVRDWVAGRRPNHGFFIDGQKDPPRDNNNECVSLLEDFDLDVTVR